jgi:hypothetical protein
MRLERIDTSLWGELTIRDLSIEYAGTTIVRIPRAGLGYSLIPLLWREARIEITVVNPAINLERENDGEMMESGISLSASFEVTRPECRFDCV